MKAAIEKGRGFLTSNLAMAQGGPKSLAAYALIKTGTNKADAVIQDAIKAAIKEVEAITVPACRG